MAAFNDPQFMGAWVSHRGHMVDLAFRMLGDIGAAEDVVREAFSCLANTPPGEINDTGDG